MNKLCWSAVHCVRVVLAQHFDLNMYDVISMRNFFFFIPVKSIIDDEIKSGIPSDRIVLGGFSQGGALALYTALTMEKPLAGILALSSWLPLHKTFPEVLKGNKDIPILQCHGTADPIVAYAFGQMTNEVLHKLCSKHEFKSYSGLPHSSSPQEMKDVREWISKVLP